MEISCNVIRDLLPLYAEDMVSEDSKVIVEAHLCDCRSCRDSLTAMRTPVEIPRENGDSLRATVERITKNIIVSVMALILVAVTLVGLFFGIMIHPMPVPMEDILVSVTEQDGEIVEEMTALGTSVIQSRSQKDPVTGERINIKSSYRSLHNILFGSVPVADQTYTMDYRIYKLKSIWYYEDGTLIHLWGDEAVPEIETEIGSAWLWYALGLGILTAILTHWLKRKKLGVASLFFFNVAASDLIITGGHWFPFSGSPMELFALKVCIVLLALLLTFSIAFCSYLWRNRNNLF